MLPPKDSAEQKILVIYILCEIRIKLEEVPQLIIAHIAN